MADEETMKVMFPNLYREVKAKRRCIRIDAVRTSIDEAEAIASDPYKLDVIYFLRKSRNVKEAEEVIAFYERIGEINAEYANSLRKQLHEKGLRSFQTLL
ncbi:MAG: DUF2095 family protein [Candidatus Methanomethylicia archaeon]